MRVCDCEIKNQPDSYIEMIKDHVLGLSQEDVEVHKADRQGADKTCYYRRNLSNRKSFGFKVYHTCLQYSLFHIFGRIERFENNLHLKMLILYSLLCGS